MKRSPRPGLLVVLSDFLDPGAFETALVRAAAAGHDVALVQVLAAEEVEPPLDGDYALEDAETGALVEVTIDARDDRRVPRAPRRACSRRSARSRRRTARAYVRALTDRADDRRRSAASSRGAVD